MKVSSTNSILGLTSEQRSIWSRKGFTNSITGSMRCHGIHMVVISVGLYIQVGFNKTHSMAFINKLGSGLMWTAALVYKLMHALNLPVDIRNVCVLLAPWMAGNTSIVAYLLTK